jgi:hypothetical protein
VAKRQQTWKIFSSACLGTVLKRITLDQISAHPWFSKKYASDVEGDWLQTGLPDLGEAPTYVWRYGTAFRIS